MTEIKISDRLSVPAFDTIEEAMNAEPIPNELLLPGYAVLFELHGKYAVYVHREARYYGEYLPRGSKVLFGSKHRIGEPMNWEPKGNVSDEEYNLISAALGSEVAAKLKAINDKLKDSE